MLSPLRGCRSTLQYRLHIPDYCDCSDYSIFSGVYFDDASQCPLHSRQMCCQLGNLLLGVSPKFTCGRLVNASPIRKWPGVRTRRSLGSAEIGLSGREFKIPLTSITKVLNSLKVNNWSVSTRLTWCLQHLTADSHMPPKCGERCGIKCHFIPWLLENCCQSCWWVSEFKSAYSSWSLLSALTKFFPLSDYTSEGLPLGAMNRFNSAIKPSVFMSLTTSRWMALTKREINMATYTLSRVRFRNFFSLT